MAISVCITSAVADRLKKEVENGNLSIQKLDEMTSQERHNYFANLTDESTATVINAGFEQAITSSVQGAVKDWVDKVFNPQEKVEVSPKDRNALITGAKSGEYNDMVGMTKEELTNKFQSMGFEDKVAQKLGSTFIKLDATSTQRDIESWAYQQGKSELGGLVSKVEELYSKGIVNPKNQQDTLEDLIALQMGAKVTEEELSRIMDYSQKLTDLSVNKDQFGNPTLEYMKVRREMENFMDSLNPQSELKIATSSVSRAMMLLSPKSFNMNVIGNSTMAVLSGIERRIMNLSLGIHPSLAKVMADYVKTAVTTYSQTSFDITRSMDLSIRKKTLGEDIIHSQGEGRFRASARVLEDIVYNKMLGVPDVAYASIAFADTTSILAMKEAKRLGLRKQEATNKAIEIMKDAMSIEPKTEIGYVIRHTAIAEAQYSTSTQDGFLAEKAMGIRKWLNVGDVRYGEMTIPFVKTPANIVETGVKYGGGGLVTSAIKFAEIWNNKIALGLS